MVINHKTEFIQVNEEPQKPVVYFTGKPEFIIGGRACVNALNHPTAGPGAIVTSEVVKKVSDTEFHTLNTIYKQKQVNELVIKLRTRAEIRRQIDSRKSVQEGKPDRIADLLEEAADEIERLQAHDPASEQFKLANDLSVS